MAKGRHRARVVVPKGGGKPFAQFYPHEATETWEQHVAEFVEHQATRTTVEGRGVDFVLPLTGRCLLTLRFNMHKPASYAKSVVHHTKKPDVDNLAKAVIDGLVRGRILEDDNCVTDLSVAKRYESNDHPLGVEIDLTLIADTV